MRVVITEDIISRALNESIDEFMLEEGWLGDKWNGFKNNTIAGKWLTKAGNWLNNAAAMYMDGKTGGRWNRTYNTQATGNGNNVSVGTYYLKNWFEKHYRRLYEIIYGDSYGNKMRYMAKMGRYKEEFEYDWKTNTYSAYDEDRRVYYKFKVSPTGEPAVLGVYNSAGGEITQTNCSDINRDEGSYTYKFPGKNSFDITIYCKEDESTPEAYIQKNCTPDSFSEYTRNTLEDGPFKSAVRYYLQTQVFDYIEKNGGSNGTKNNINYGYLISLFTMTHYIQWYSKNKQQIDNAIKQSSEQPAEGAADTQQGNAATGQQGNAAGAQNNGGNANQPTGKTTEPVPSNSDGTFGNKKDIYATYNGKDRRYSGWRYSTDRNGEAVWYNPNNPKQAIFA